MRINQNRSNPILNKTAQTLITSAFNNKPNMKMTIGVLNDGQASYKLFDATGEIPYKSYTYEIGSAGKTLTTSLLAKYVASGAMALDDSVAKYIPELGRDRYFPTLRRLATHTAGYPVHLPMSRQEMEMVLSYQSLKKPISGMKLLEMDFDKMIATAKGETLTDRDYEWQYSNLGMALLGCAVGRAAGTSFADAMAKFITEDLKLPSTCAGNGGGDLLAGYDVQHRHVGNMNLDAGNYITPAGNFTSCARDMLEFARLNAYEEINCLKLCHQRHDVNAPGHDMGLGWWIDPSRPSVYYHSGNTDGFASMIAFDKQKKNAVVILTNVQDYDEREELFMEVLNG